MDGTSTFSLTTFSFTIFKLKLGKTHKLLTKLQNGTSTDVLLHQSPHGSISFLVEAVEVSLKEATEQVADTSTILGSSILITWIGFQSKWKKTKTNFLQPDNLLQLSTTPMTKDSTYSVVGQTNGSMICGCCLLEISQVHPMLLITSSQKSVH